jgi:hypothetical protein
MMIMRTFWLLGIFYVVGLMVLISTFMFKSDEELMKPPGTRNPLHIRIGAAVILLALAIGVFGTLGFLAQIWEQ